MKIGFKEIMLLIGILGALIAIQMSCGNSGGDDDDNNATDDDTADDDTADDDTGATPPKIPSGHDLTADCYSCHNNPKPHNGQYNAPSDCLNCHQPA